MTEEKNSSNNCPIISKKTKRNNYKFFYKLIGNNVKIERRLYKVFLGAFFVIGLIFTIEILFIAFGGDKIKLSDLGPFGDFFGGMLNPILSFCTFMALLMTIVLQQKELSLTRKELNETQKATRDSANALKEQSNSIKIQNFETTFFNMLNLHNEIISNITIGNYISFGYNTNKWEKVTLYEDSNSIMSRKAIKLISDSFNNFIKSVNSYRKVPKIYDLCHESFQDILGHYFGNIYQILKFISSNTDIQDKTKYSDLFRTQFSSAELELLFYHCTGHIGSKNFKNYIEEFQFFEHLVVKENKSFNYIFSLNIYNDKAFGENEEIIKAISLENKKFREEIENLENKKNKKGKEIGQLSKNYFYKKDYELAIETLDLAISQLEKEFEEIKNRLNFGSENIKKDKEKEIMEIYLLKSDIYFEMGNNEKGKEILDKI